MLLQFIIAILLAAAVCALAYYKKWLGAGGGSAAFILGVVVWIAGGWRAALPMLLFFISGSLFSLTAKTNVTDEKDKKARDHIQVLCNGGVAGLCLVCFLLTRNVLFQQAYWMSIAISTADTWSSGIGINYGRKVVDIKNGRPLMKGLSGGVSIAGTLGGLAGSLLIAITGWVIFRADFKPLLVAVAGFAGMLVDSLLGSLLQSRYRLENGSLAEYIPVSETGYLEKGLKWMTNDWVNLLSNILVTALGLVAMIFFT